MFSFTVQTVGFAHGTDMLVSFCALFSESREHFLMQSTFTECVKVFVFVIRLRLEHEVLSVGAFLSKPVSSLYFEQCLIRVPSNFVVASTTRTPALCTSMKSCTVSAENHTCDTLRQVFRNTT